MPFKSKKQMKYLFSQKPEIAKRWVKEAKAENKPYIQKAKKSKNVFKKG